MKISAQDVKRVKGQGFLRNRGTDCFSGRIITENGVLSAEQLKNVSDAAARFGNGTVAFTTRLTVELPGIAFENIPDFQAFVADAGLVTGGTGPKVRPVVACKGTTCVFGLYDTQGLATEIHKRFYEGYRSVTLPHKFKIAVGGCPNNCVKPDLNDLGIVGQRAPAPDLSKCRKCGKCVTAAVCPMGAMARGENGLEISSELCSRCGRCTESCPFGVTPATETGYKLYIGGRWGKKTRMGDALSHLFTRDEALDMIEKVILLFLREGLKGERFAVTIERLGLAAVEKMLFTEDLLANKAGILAAQAD